MSVLFSYPEYVEKLSNNAKAFLLTHPCMNDVDRNFFETVAMLKYFNPEKYITMEDIKEARSKVRKEVVDKRW